MGKYKGLTIKNHPLCPECGSKNVEVVNDPGACKCKGNCWSHPECKDCGYGGYINSEGIFWDDSDKKVDEDEASRENWRRHDVERNELYPKMLPDLKELKLKRIDLRRENRNDHGHPEIKRGRWYLLGIYGTWMISKAKRMYQDNGWEFSVGLHYTPLTMVDILFEIEGMSEYKHNPLGMIGYDKEEEDE